MATNLVTELDGCSLNVLSYGDAESAVLCLHGVTRCGRDWAPVAPWLCTNRQVFALDFRGHGDSHPSQNGYRVIDYVDDALLALREVVGRPAIVWGHSLGAMVAAVVAARAADAVTAVILEDPPFGAMGSRIGDGPLLSYFQGLRQIRLSSRSESVGQIARRLGEMRFGPPDDSQSMRLGEQRDAAALRFSARCLTRLDPELFEPIVAGRWLDGYSLDEVCEAIGCPTLLLQADESCGGMLAAEEADLLERRIADCTRVRFNGAGHLIHWTRIEETVRYVSSFLESLDPAPRQAPLKTSGQQNHAPAIG